MPKHYPFDDQTSQILQNAHFDEEVFLGLQEQLRKSGGVRAQNQIQGTVQAPAAGSVVPLPPVGSSERKALEARGQEAIKQGEVASIVLAGGMATRFGSVVKAAVDIGPSFSFLAAKAADTRHASETHGGPVPLFPMTSFATDAEVRAHAEALAASAPTLEPFMQSVSLRLKTDGSLFLKEDGRPSLYAPGHGDLPDAFRNAGLLERFLERGGTTLVMSNVDNVAATLDPAIIGAHLASERSISVEVTNKEPGDKGGAPAVVDGHLQIVEAFRFPQGFDQDTIPVFNTNTLLFDATLFSKTFPLTWFPVTKQVDGQDVIQFERLIGQLTAFVPTHFIHVPRVGLESRFEPVKDPDELERRRDHLLALLKARGIR